MFKGFRLPDDPGATFFVALVPVFVFVVLIYFGLQLEELNASIKLGLVTVTGIWLGLGVPAWPYRVATIAVLSPPFVFFCIIENRFEPEYFVLQISFLSVSFLTTLVLRWIISIEGGWRTFHRLSLVDLFFIVGLFSLAALLFRIGFSEEQLETTWNNSRLPQPNYLLFIAALSLLWGCSATALAGLLLLRSKRMNLIWIGGLVAWHGISIPLSSFAIYFQDPSWSENYLLYAITWQCCIEASVILILFPLHIVARHFGLRLLRTPIQQSPKTES